MQIIGISLKYSKSILATHPVNIEKSLCSFCVRVSRVILKKLGTMLQYDLEDVAYKADSIYKDTF